MAKFYCKKGNGCSLAGGSVSITFILFPNQSKAALSNCPESSNPRSTLHLYFPTSSDNCFPEYGTPYGISTSPANPFNVVDLDSGIGTLFGIAQDVDINDNDSQDYSRV